MQVIIRYCNSWSYRPKASRLEEEIKEAFQDAQVTLEIGGRGEFSVTVDGKEIFSKQKLDEPRFPNQGEIIELIKQ